ncbi:MAG: DUF4430 domain-containing protein [Coriobacteriales bacterium]|jgi:hypothetical protein|nr:DUF4430 domain-containing protein [Coriobacteriales bacterium]
MLEKLTKNKVLKITFVWIAAVAILVAVWLLAPGTGKPEVAGSALTGDREIALANDEKNLAADSDTQAANNLTAPVSGLPTSDDFTEPDNSNNGNASNLSGGNGGYHSNSGNSSRGDANTNTGGSFTLPPVINPGTSQPTQPTRPTVTLSIEASTAGRGTILTTQTVEFTDGETVFDVLYRVCRANGIHMSSRFTPIYYSAYIEGIDNLYEFDKGPLSGWMYRVNGWYPNYGCSKYVLQNNDNIEWCYTCDLGRDIGGEFAAIGGH